MWFPILRAIVLDLSQGFTYNYSVFHEIMNGSCSKWMLRWTMTLRHFHVNGEPYEELNQGRLPFFWAFSLDYLMTCPMSGKGQAPGVQRENNAMTPNRAVSPQQCLKRKPVGKSGNLSCPNLANVNKTTPSLKQMSLFYSVGFPKWFRKL